MFLVYAFFGPYFPGFLAHRGQDLKSVVQLMFFTTDGILGTPISVSATFIFVFLLFGAFLVKTGVGAYFNDLAVVLAGRLVGGPAKVAIFSSALQGTISGSSVANVVGSGSYTIPMMKKLGYKKEFAGGVEAAASTGGQIMPPIMGAAAFLMVEFIGGVTYWQIAKAAAIPALLYFTGIWIMTHFEAKRVGLKGMTEDQIPDRKKTLKKIYLLLPIIGIIVFLLIGIPTMKAALLGIVLTIIVSSFDKSTRLGFKDMIEALVDGARTALGCCGSNSLCWYYRRCCCEDRFRLKPCYWVDFSCRWEHLPDIVLYNACSYRFGHGFTDNSELCYNVNNRCSCDYYASYA